MSSNQSLVAAGSGGGRVRAATVAAYIVLERAIRSSPAFLFLSVSLLAAVAYILYKALRYIYSNCITLIAS